MSDRPRLNYLNAVIMEAQRCGNIVSQNLLRKVGNDVVVEGHKIHKNSFFIAQISAIHFDPTVIFALKRIYVFRYLMSRPNSSQNAFWT
jgi:cytochrome P450